MGRHSVPDPDDEPAVEEHPEESPTQRFGYTEEPDHGPEYPQYGARDHDEPDR